MKDRYEKDFERAKKELLKRNLSEKNKEIILKFLDRLGAEGITKVRQLKYLYTLCNISTLLKKDFSKTNKQDIIKLCSEINNSKYKEWTKHDYKVVIKRFYKWLREEEGQKFAKRVYPEEVEWIVPTMKRNRKQFPNELLTIEDVKKLAENTNNLRDRCFVLTLYESGARIGELLNLTLKDIEPDKYGVKINLFGKTGSRKIRLIASSPAISNWLMDHPDRNNKESMLFCGMWAKKRGEEINYQTFRLMLQDLAKKANINKPVNPHHFRHSRATELSKTFTEAQLCQYMGWVPGSQEASTYVHLSGRDMDNAILKLNGLSEEEPEMSQFKPITCPRCGIVNSPDSKFCSHCSMGLDLQAVIDYEKTSKETLKNVDDPKKLQSMLEVLIKKVEQLEREKYR